MYIQNKSTHFETQKTWCVCCRCVCLFVGDMWVQVFWPTGDNKACQLPLISHQDKVHWIKYIGSVQASSKWLVLCLYMLSNCGNTECWHCSEPVFGECLFVQQMSPTVYLTHTPSFIAGSQRVVHGPVGTARSRHGVCEINFVFYCKLKGKNIVLIISFI